MSHPKFFHGLKCLSGKGMENVVTIGSFDGVHRGHSVVLRQVKDKARELGIPSLAIVFEPQPHEYFSKQSAPARLMRLREKVHALFAEGLDRVLCLKFNHDFRSLTAEQFVEKVLINGVGVKHLIIGDDFRFGCDRAGDYDMLCRAGARLGFGVSNTNTQCWKNARISSTRIRALLADDLLGDAEALLGSPYSVSGRVIYGRQLGRTIGFPTANIGIGRYRSAVDGVYAVEVRRGDTSGVCVSGQTSNNTTASESLWQGVANVGVRPTVGGRAKPLLEVHLFDSDELLYGQFLTVIFKKKLRDEQRFDNLDELKLQIQRDCDRAKHYFRKHETS